MRLDKPVGILLLLWPPFWVITLISEGLLLHFISIIFLIGVITTRSIGCVINDFFDKDYDFKVSRTKERPFAANLISKQEVIFIFLVCCSSTTSSEIATAPIMELTYQNLDGEFVNENLTNKNTIIVFWADY